MGFLDGIRDRLGIGLEGDDPEPPRAQGPVPWERLPAEPDAAWSLFSAYLQSPSANVSRFALGAASAGHATSTIQAYAMRWRWHARRAALEQHLARARAEGAADAARAQGEQMARMAQAMLDAAELARTALTLRGGLEAMAPKDVLALEAKAIELSRLLRGEVTARTGLDLSGLTDEQIAALRAIAEKAG